MIFFTILILLHGLIHTLGFAKAFNLIKVEQLVLPISYPDGDFTYGELEYKDLKHNASGFVWRYLIKELSVKE
ncbi:hypothetical protein FJY90_08410 [Candidatus Gottesmanbacteria bacterium]|nr:hypothetical protein [Candidatus Gottesmanbacteria bacterium]